MRIQIRRIDVVIRVLIVLSLIFGCFDSALLYRNWKNNSSADIVDEDANILSDDLQTGESDPDQLVTTADTQYEPVFDDIEGMTYSENHKQKIPPIISDDDIAITVRVNPSVITTADILTMHVDITNMILEIKQGLEFIDYLNDTLVFVESISEDVVFNQDRNAVIYQIQELLPGETLSLEYKLKVNPEIVNQSSIGEAWAHTVYLQSVSDSNNEGYDGTVVWMVDDATQNQKQFSLLSQNGGWIENNDISIYASPDSISGNSIAAIEIQEDNKNGPELQFSVDLYDLEDNIPSEIAVNETHYPITNDKPTVIEEPVYLQVKFDSIIDLESLPSGTEPYIATFDETAKVWVKVPLASIDYENNTVSSYASHFSVWGAGLGSALPQNGANVLLFDQPYVSLFSGRASYNFPIWAPSGRAGFGPSVSLSYSSRTVDGVLGDIQAPWVGMGWNMDAIEIVRKISTDENGFGYSNDFALTINGTVYSLVEDPILKGRYHTEDASFYFIQRHNPALGNDDGVQNATKEWWEVISPSGIHYRLGWTDDAEQVSMMPGYYCLTGYPCTVPSGAYTSLGYAGTGVDIVAMRWRVDQIVDTHQNYVQYNYAEETKNVGSIEFDHASYLSTIDYTGHLNTDGTVDTSIPMAYQIKFNLEDRPAVMGDNPSGRVYDWDNFENKRLGSIEILYHCAPGSTCEDTRSGTPATVSDVVLRTYDFTYDVHQIPSADGTQVLSDIDISAGGYTENGESVAYVSLPSVAFDYTDLPNQAEDNPLIEHFVYPRLIGVDNGYGAALAFDYERDNRAETYWYNYRIKHIEVDNGFDDVRKTSYTYYSPTYIDNDKELLGFGYVDQSTFDFDQTTKLSFARHYYSTTYPDYGKETTTEVYNPADTTVFLKTINTWSGDNTGVPTGVNFRYISQAKYYQSNGSSLVQTGLNQFTYNPYTGNLTEKRGYKGDELYTIEHYEYGINTEEDVYITDRVLRSTLTDGNGIIQSDTRYMYDGSTSGEPTKGDVTLIQNLAGINSSVTVDSGYAYDAYGNMLDSINYAAYGTAGQIPTFNGSSDQKNQVVYDSVFQMLPVSSINPLGYTTTNDLLFTLGAASSTTDANQETIYHTYDGLGRALTSTANGFSGYAQAGYAGYTSKTVYPTNYQTDATTGKKYHMLEMQIWDPIGENEQGVATPGYRSIWGIYDAQGTIRQTQMMLPDGSVQLVDVALNAQGSTSTESEPHTASITPGSYSPIDWGTTAHSTYAYDFMQRVTNMTAPDGRSSQYEYPFFAKESIDAAGHKKRYEYDYLNRLIKVKEFTGSDPSFDLYSTMTYTYDVHNNLISVTDQEDSITRLGYDWLGRKLFIKSPDMGFWSYDYNAMGSLTRQNDARDETVCLYYDQLNRLTGKTYATSGNCATTPASEDLVVSFGFGDGTAGKPYGYRTSMLDDTGSTSWSYTDSARTISENRQISGNSYQFTTYTDYLGRVTQENDPGEQVNYHYDITGRVVNMDAGQDLDLIHLAYNNFSQIESMAFKQNSQQVTRENTYNATTHRLDAFKIYNGTSWSEENELMNFSYQYDLLDNITSISDSQLEDEYTFTYDDVNRLISAQSVHDTDYNYRQAYDYDATGNIMSVSNWRYTFYPQGVYEDDFEGISMNQNWIPQTTVNASSENEHSSSAVGAEVLFYFEGNGIGYVRRVGPDQGIMEVYIDNELVDQIDNYAAAEAYQQLAVIPVEAGEHKLQLMISESKNENSSGYSSNLDTLEVYNELPIFTATPTLTYTPSVTFTPTYTTLSVGTYQENDGVINFSGDWQIDSGATYAESAQASSNVSGAEFTFLFTGNHFDLVHSVGPDHGVAEICFDAGSLDETCETVDFYDASSLAQITTDYEVSYGMHLIRVSHTGQQNENATDSYISVDQLVIIADTPTQTPTASDTATITLTPSETPMPSDTPTPSDTPVASETPVASDTPVLSETPVSTETVEITNTHTPDGAETATETPVFSVTPEWSETPTPDSSNTPNSANTETLQPSDTATLSPTVSQTPENTHTPSQTLTDAPTAIPTEEPNTPRFLNAVGYRKSDKTYDQMGIIVPAGGDDRILLVALESGSSINSIQAILNSAWTDLPILTTLTLSNGSTYQIRYLLNPPAGERPLNFSTSSSTTVYFTAAVFDRVDPTNPFGRITKNTGTGTAVHTDIYANPNDLVVSFAGAYSGEETLITPQSGQSLAWRERYMALGYQQGSIAMDWTLPSSKNWGQILIALNPNRTLQDNDSRLDYQGTWDTATNSSFSGGTEHVANAPGEEVRFHFYGNQLKLYYAKDVNRGIAEVCIDEGTASEICQNIDQYAAAFAAKQSTIFSVNNSGHTVHMRYTGTRNQDATGFIVGLDKLSVAEFLPTVTPTFTATLSPTPTLIFTPSSTVTPTSTPTYELTSVPTEEPNTPRFLNSVSKRKVETWSDQMSFSVPGGGDDRIMLVAFQLMGTRNEAQYMIDGETGWLNLSHIKTITGSNGKTIGLYYTRNMSLSTKTMYVRASSHTYGTIWMGAAAFDRVDQTSPFGRIESNLGTGTTAHTDIYANPDELVVGVSGNWYDDTPVMAPASGQSIAWRINQIAMGYQQGSEDMDWTLSNRQWGQILLALKPNHTLQDNDSRLDYLGAWDTATNSSFSGGTEHVANALDEQVSFHFYGNQLKLYYAKDVNRGIAEVCIDEGTASEVCQNIDQYAAAFAAKQSTIFSVNNSGHTVHMRYTGTRNQDATGFIVGLDKISVAEFLPTVTPTFTSTFTPTATATQYSVSPLIVSSSSTLRNEYTNTNGSYNFTVPSTAENRLMIVHIAMFDTFSDYNCIISIKRGRAKI
ncbi:MAG: hypothetical protein JEZ00_07400 [Anaerolineaceae bacterium]|nr:hypothetical protein [Anaerolineaceae bacterium]